MSFGSDNPSESSVVAAPPVVPATTPSLSDLNELAETSAKQIEDPELIAALQRLRSTSMKTSVSDTELSLPQLVVWLRNNPGLRLSLSFRSCE